MFLSPFGPSVVCGAPVIPDKKEVVAEVGVDIADALDLLAVSDEKSDSQREKDLKR